MTHRIYVPGALVEYLETRTEYRPTCETLNPSVKQKREKIHKKVAYQLFLKWCAENNKELPERYRWCDFKYDVGNLDGTGYRVYSNYQNTFWYGRIWYDLHPELDPSLQ